MASMPPPAVLVAARALLAECFVITTAFASYAAAASLLRDAPRHVRWIGAVATGIWLATAGFHALTALHVFTWPIAALAVLALGAVSYATEWRSGNARRAARSDRRFFAAVVRRVRRGRLTWLAGILSLGFLPTVLRSLVAPILSWDGLTYHGLKAALPVQTGSVSFLQAPGQWAYVGPTWGGHEALASWAILPFHSDLLSTFAESVQFVALGLALFTLGRLGRVREPLGSLVVMALLATPTLQLLVGSGYVEVGAMMALAAGIVLLVWALQARSAAALLLAGAAIGVCGGMKINLLAVVAPLVVLLGVAVLRLRTRGARARLVIAAGAVCLVATPIVPWLALSAVYAGTPLAPLPVRVGGVVLGSAPPEMQWFVTRPGLSGETLGSAVRGLYPVLKPSIYVNERLGPFTAILLLAGIVGAVRLARALPWLGVTALVTALTTTVAYFAPDLHVVRALWATSSSRFLLPAVVAVGPLAAAGIPLRSWPGRTLAALCVLATGLQLYLSYDHGVLAPSRRGMALVAVGGLALAILLWLAQRARPLHLALVALLVAVTLSGLHWLRAGLRYDMLAVEFQIHERFRYFSEPARTIDDPAHPRIVAVTGGIQQNLNNIFAFPFLGTSFQNRLIYVTPARDARLLHHGAPNVNADFAAALDMERWLSRLDAAGVTDVISFMPRSAEQAFMESRPARFRKRAGEESWGLFELVEAR